MASVNRVIIVGHLGKDPDPKYLPSGDCVTSVSVATSESWKNKAGEKQEHTEWHNTVFFGKLAEIAAEYLKKGALVYIEGKIRTEKWQAKDGSDRYTTKIIADRMQMLGSKNTQTTGGDAPAPKAERQQQSGSEKYAAAKGGASFDDMDDDIPF